MAIRPIDAQMMVHRTSETPRMTNADPQTASASANQFAQDFKREVLNQGQQVNNTNNAEKGDVDKDGRGGAAYSDNRGNKQGQDKDAKDKDSKPMFKNEHGRFSAKA